MALRTSLVIDGDATGGVRALQQTDAAMAATETEAQDLARAYAAADASIGQLAKEQANATREIAEAKAQLSAGEITLEQYNRTILETKTNLGAMQREQRQTAKAFQEADAAYAGSLANQVSGSQRAVRAHEATERAVTKSKGSLTQLSFQVNDAATMALSGASAFQILATQGGQVFQVFQMAEGGAKGLMAEIGGAALRFAPLIAVLAVAGGAFALFQRSMVDGTDPKELTANLGLTKSEIKQLKDVGISTADVLKATFQVLAEQAGISFDDMGKGWSQVLDWMTDVGRSALANIYANTVGTMKAIAAAVLAVKDGKGLGGAWDAAAGAYTGAQAEANKYLTDTGKAIRDRALQNEREDLARQAAAIKAERTPKSDAKAETLAREMRATEDLIDSLYKLATAYGVSDAAAMHAEVVAKAREQGIKKEADLAVYTQLQLRKAVAEQARDAAQSVADLNYQAKAQETVNEAVRAGTLDIENADTALAAITQRRSLAAAIGVAAAINDVKGLQATKKAMSELEEAQIRSNNAAKVKQSLSAYEAGMKAGNNRLAELREELRLIDETDEARARSMARLKAEQEASSWKGVDADQIAAYIAQQEEIAAQGVRNRQAQDAYNDSLIATAEKWDIIAGKVETAADGMGDAFGSVGQAIGDMAAIYTRFHADRERADAEHLQAIRAAGRNEQLIAQENARYALRSSGAQVQAYGDMASAAKGFFKEGSTGYQALAAAEKVYRVAQLAMSLQAMVQNALETTTTVANAGVRATAEGTAGIAAQAKLPFPFNIAAMAATGAALIAAGVAVLGGGGGGANTLPASNTGTGTVLGDGDAGSESITRAIDALRDVDTLMLDSSREMAASLKSIEGQIGGFASLVLRTGNINASAGVTEGFKSNGIGAGAAGAGLGAAGYALAAGSFAGPIGIAIGGVLGAVLSPLMKSLFGTKTKVVGSGLYGGEQTLSDILSDGYDASYYSDVQKKKKFFGLTTSTKYSTKYAEADSGLENQFTLILREFNDAISAAAGPLGESTDEIKAKLGSFVVDIGKIDLKDLTGEEIEEKLSAVFGAAADKMAAAAFPGIERFQAVGEGLFETLVRVSSTVESVTASLGLLGSSAASMSVDAKVALAGQFENVGAFSSAVEAYFETFYSQEEQATARTAQMAQVFDSLGTAMPASIEAFRALVEAQDLTTAAGQSTYATLLQLAPAFADLQASMDGAKSAADVLAERQDLERQRLEAMGDTNAIRQLDLGKLDPSNRAYQAETWAMQESAKAAADLAAQQKAAGEEARRLAIEIAEIEDPARAAAMQLADQRNAVLEANKADFDRLQVLRAAAVQAAETTRLAEAEAERQKGIAAQARQLAIAIAELEDPAKAAAMQLADQRATYDYVNQAEFDRLQVLKGVAAQLVETTRIAEEEAARQKVIADEARQLAIAIAEIEDPARAAAMQLEDQRAALQEANRAEFDRLQALRASTQAAQEAAQAAAELAAKQKAMSDEVAGLDRQWLELTGNTEKLRELQLGDLLSDEARDLQRKIWAEQERQAAVAASQAAAEEAAKAYADAVAEQAQRVQDARDQVAAAHERETSALQATADKMRDYAGSMRELRESLIEGIDGARDYASSRARFLNTAQQAGQFDEAAMGRFTGDANAFAAAALANAATAVDYDRDIALIAREAFKLEELAGGKASALEREKAAMDAQLKTALGVDALNEKATTFTEALQNLTDVQAIVIPDFTSTVSGGIEVLADKMQQSIDANAKQSEERRAEGVSLIGRVANLETLLQRVVRGNKVMIGTYDPLAVDPGTVTVKGSVTVDNEPDNPVPTAPAPEPA